MRLIPDCRDMSRLLSDARDEGGLGLRAYLHLAICDVCRRLRAQWDALAVAVRREPSGAAVLSADAKRRLKKALEKS